MRSLVMAVVVGGLLVDIATSAHADDRGSAREHYAKGTKAFDLGLYEAAITEYMAAYQIRDDPAILFNLAQAHRLAGHTTEALRFYRVYLMKQPNVGVRAAVEQRIAELQKQLDAQTRPTPTLGPTPEAMHVVPPPVAPIVAPASSEPESLTPPKDAPPPAITVQPTASAPADRGRAERIAGLTTGAVGIAALAGGIAFGVLAKQSGDDLSSLARNGGTYDASRDSAGHNQQIVEGVLLGVGGAALVAGTVVFALGVREQRRHRRETDSAHAGFVLHGAYQ